MFMCKVIFNHFLAQDEQKSKLDFASFLYSPVIVRCCDGEDNIFFNFFPLCYSDILNYNWYFFLPISCFVLDHKIKYSFGKHYKTG